MNLAEVLGMRGDFIDPREGRLHNLEQAVAAGLTATANILADLQAGRPAAEVGTSADPSARELGVAMETRLAALQVEMGQMQQDRQAAADRIASLEHRLAVQESGEPPVASVEIAQIRAELDVLG